MEEECLQPFRTRPGSSRIFLTLVSNPLAISGAGKENPTPSSVVNHPRRGSDFNQRLKSLNLRKLLEARVGIGPFLARFRIKNAIFYGLHKQTRSLLTHYTSTAPLLTYLLNAT